MALARAGTRGLRMFGAASPTLTENDVLKIQTLVKSSGKKPSTKWTVLAEKPQPLCAGESPWTDGYRLAQEWSAKTGIRHKRDGAVDVEEHLERLGVTFSDIELDAAATAGLAVQPAQGAPYIFVNRRNPRCEFPSGKRVILAHELCHLLHDRAHGRDLAMISGPYRWSDGAFQCLTVSERIENACRRIRELVFSPRSIGNGVCHPARENCRSISGLITPIHTTAWTGGFFFPCEIEILCALT